MSEIKKDGIEKANEAKKTENEKQFLGTETVDVTAMAEEQKKPEDKPKETIEDIDNKKPGDEPNPNDDNNGEDKVVKIEDINKEFGTKFSSIDGLRKSVFASGTEIARMQAEILALSEKAGVEYKPEEIEVKIDTEKDYVETYRKMNKMAAELKLKRTEIKHEIIKKEKESRTVAKKSSFEGKTKEQLMEEFEADPEAYVKKIREEGYKAGQEETKNKTEIESEEQKIQDEKLINEVETWRISRGIVRESELDKEIYKVLTDDTFKDIDMSKDVVKYLNLALKIAQGNLAAKPKEKKFDENGEEIIEEDVVVEEEITDENADKKQAAIETGSKAKKIVVKSKETEEDKIADSIVQAGKRVNEFL